MSYNNSRYSSPCRFDGKTSSGFNSNRNNEESQDTKSMSHDPRYFRAVMLDGSVSTSSPAFHNYRNNEGPQMLRGSVPYRNRYPRFRNIQRNVSRRGYNEPVAQQLEQKTNTQIKPPDWEAIISTMNEDGGVYTSDEEELDRKCKTFKDDFEKLFKNRGDCNHYSDSDQDEVMEVATTHVTFEETSVVTTTTYGDAALNNNNNTDVLSENLARLPSSSTTHIDVSIQLLSSSTQLSEDHPCSMPEETLHMYFGIREVSDLQLSFGSHIFHVHRQFLEQFICNMDELLSGKIVEWIPMKKICEILYGYRMSDEEFLVCSNNTEKNQIDKFWKEGNDIMHLARRLKIPAVENYIDRAVALSRCNDFQNCSFCSQQRIMFASVYNLKVAKAFLRLPEPVRVIDDSVFADIMAP